MTYEKEILPSSNTFGNLGYKTTVFREETLNEAAQT